MADLSTAGLAPPPLTPLLVIPLVFLPTLLPPAQVISKHMDDRLYGYLLEHTREPPVLASLRAATAEQFPTGARMQVRPAGLAC